MKIWERAEPIGLKMINKVYSTSFFWVWTFSPFPGDESAAGSAALAGRELGFTWPDLAISGPRAPDRLAGGTGRDLLEHPLAKGKLWNVREQEIERERERETDRSKLGDIR